MINQLIARARARLRGIDRGRIRHWAMALLVLAVTYFAGPFIDANLGFYRVKYWLFQHLSELTLTPLKPKVVKLLLIDDKDYWLGPPAGRRPIKRDYLARIVDKLAESKVAVIALDFDLRTLSPNSAQIASEYKQETDLLMIAIGRAAQSHKVVLAKTIWFDSRGRYVADPDIYQAYGLCSVSEPTGRWRSAGTPEFPLSPVAKENIECGYVSLPFDMRMVPGRIQLADGRLLDSFSLAAARALEPAVTRAVDTSAKLGGYLAPSDWTKAHAVSTVGSLLLASPKQLQSIVSAPIVIVGGDWSSLAYSRGDSADIHATPVGNLIGAMVHANFVEATLGRRTFGPTADWLPEACELLFGLLAAILFSFEHGLATKLLALVVATLSLVVAEWLLLQLTGVFFEAFVPVLGLWIHSLLERLLGSNTEGQPCHSNEPGNAH